MAAKTTKKAQNADEVKKKGRKSTKAAQPKPEEIKLSDVKVEQSHMDSVVVSAEPVQSTNPLKCLKPEELWKMRYVEAEARVSQREAMIAQLTKKMILMQIDPKGMVAAEDLKIESANNAANSAKAEYRKIMADAGERLGLNLSGCAIDPDTGIVIPQA